MRLSAEEWERGVRLRNWLVNACTANECLGDNGWLDGQMVGWVNRWMDGWKEEWGSGENDTYDVGG